MTAHSAACAHCELPLGPGEGLCDEVDGRTERFCCAGCRGIRRLLREEGLDRYYSLRRGWTPGPPQDQPVEPADFAALPRDVEGGLREADVAVSGLRCSSCAWLIERHLRRKPGVAEARVNFAASRARVRWDPRAADIGEVARWIRELGYVPLPPDTAAAGEALDRERKELLVRLGTAAFLSMQIMGLSAGLYAGYFQGMERGDHAAFNAIVVLLATPVVFYSGFPFLRGAVAGIRGRAAGMDALVFLGAFSAYAYSVVALATGGEVYAETAAMVVTLVLLGRYLEAAARARARDSVVRLARLSPSRALKVGAPGGVPAAAPEEVAVSSLSPGDYVAIAPGDRIPVDGTVADGLSEADESMLTGESRPVPKTSGDRVLAGTLNGTGRLVVAVAGTGADTALARIVRAVEEAQAAKAPIQRLADRVVGRFVPAVLALAVLTLALQLRAGAALPAALMASIAVLVVACPCALGLATPLAVYVGSTRAREMGIVIRGGDVLEAAAATRHVFLDKTGTVTGGTLRLLSVVPRTMGREALLAAAAALEAPSEHAAGKAIVRAFGPGVPAEVVSWRSHPGKGVEGVVGGRRLLLGTEEFVASGGAAVDPASAAAASELAAAGNTVVLLADGERIAGILALADAVRPEAGQAVRMIRDAGAAVTMLTGDGPDAAERIAAQAGIDRRRTRATPAEKAAAVRAARADGGGVLMAGDGVNDAPALAEADVGVAMGRGAGVAVASAGAVLLADDLRLVPRLVALSRKTMAVVRQNLWWAFSYNAVALPLAAAGLLHPVVSAALMAASSLLVVGNSLRLRKARC